MKKKYLKSNDPSTFSSDKLLLGLPPHKTTNHNMYEIERDFVALLEFNKIYYRRKSKTPHAYFIGSNMDLFFRFEMTDWGDVRVIVSNIAFKFKDSLQLSEEGVPLIEFSGQCTRSMLTKIRSRGIRFRSDIVYPEKSIYFVLLKPKRTHPYWACKW